MVNKTEYQPSESDGMEEYLMQEQAMINPNRSDDITELAKALSLAQSQMKNAARDADNPFFKSTYADLASVWDAVREPFTKNGLSITQLPFYDQNRVGCRTVLMHSSGQWIASELALQPTKNDPQAAGSCLTYVRRYSLMAVCGVAPDDDDGNEASGKVPEQRQQAKPKANSNRPESRAELITKCESLFAKLMLPFEKWDAAVRLATGNKYGSWAILKKESDAHLKKLATNLLNLWTENRIDGEFVGENLMEKIEENEAKREQK